MSLFQKLVSQNHEEKTPKIQEWRNQGRLGVGAAFENFLTWNP